MLDEHSLFKLSYGVYIVSTKADEKLNGQVVTVVFQVTSNPPMIATCINKANLTCSMLQKSKKFTVSVLSEKTPLKQFATFGFKSGRAINKFEGINFKMGVNGCPIVLDNAVAFYEADIVNEYPIGEEYIMFIGKVTEAEKLNDDPVMTYAHYHEIKRGGTPTTAPTYRKPV